MILRMPSMLRGIPLEKRGFLRRMGFMGGTGWVDQISGTELGLRKRNGAHVTIDAKPAQDAFQSVPIGMEEAITAEGSMTLKACCMRRRSCARRTPGVFGRLIGKRVKVDLATLTCGRAPDHMSGAKCRPTEQLAGTNI
jgi:hypothetical protein